MGARGVNNVELGRAIGVSHVAIGNYLKEPGQLPRADGLARLAEYFGVSMESLLRPSPSPNRIKEEPVENWQARALAAERKLELVRTALDALRSKI